MTALKSVADRQPSNAQPRVELEAASWPTQPLTLVLPDTIEFRSVRPTKVLMAKIPPPPLPAAVFCAVFPVIVECVMVMVPVAAIRAMPPPSSPAVFPEIVEFSMRMMGWGAVPLALKIPPPCPVAPAEVFPEMVVPRMVMGLLPKWYKPPPSPSVVPATLPLIVLSSRISGLVLNR